jgi:hypothetical protein
MEGQRGFQKFCIDIDLGQAVTNNKYSNFDNFILSVANLILQFLLWFISVHCYYLRLYSVSCEVSDE